MLATRQQCPCRKKRVLLPRRKRIMPRPVLALVALVCSVAVAQDVDLAGGDSPTQEAMAAANARNVGRIAARVATTTEREFTNNTVAYTIDGTKY